MQPGKRPNRGTPSTDYDEFVVIGGGPVKDKKERLVRTYSDEEDTKVATTPLQIHADQGKRLLGMEISRSRLKYTEPEFASEDMLASARKVYLKCSRLIVYRY